MLSAIVTSDWHLDAYYYHKSIRTNFSERKDVEIQVAEIEKTFDYATENGISHVFMLGDISDKHELTTEAHDAVLRLLFKYDGLLNIHIVPGNHDISSIHTCSLSLLKTIADHNKFSTVKIYTEPTSTVIDDVRCNLLPFPHNKPLDDQDSLIFCHLETKNAKTDNGKTVKKGDADFSRYSGFWVSGHLHGYQKTDNYLYCGAPYQVDFGESLPCGFVHIKVKSNPLKVAHKFINSRPAIRLKNIRISSREDWNRISDDINILYKVVVDDDVSVPANIRIRYPNIVYITDRELDIHQIKVQDLPTIDLDTGLDSFLISRKLDDQQVQRGIDLVKEALNII